MTTQGGFPCVGGAPDARSTAKFDDHLSRDSLIADISFQRSVNDLGEAAALPWFVPPWLSREATSSGYRVAFAMALEWVNRLGAAERADRPDAELEHLRRIPLLICDKVGFVPFEPEAASLSFARVSSCYEWSYR